MAFARIITPWRFSRHGHDFNLAKPGDVFAVVSDPRQDDEISHDLARAGEETGHLKLLKNRPKDGAA